jgi:hypothetical protein
LVTEFCNESAVATSIAQRAGRRERVAVSRLGEQDQVVDGLVDIAQAASRAAPASARTTVSPRIPAIWRPSR